ncbi:MAG: 30S ribosomal protein S17 [Candidatus Uhrbacteria bacterium]
MLQKENKTPRVFQGLVLSSKMTKTIVVNVDRTVLHAKYQKRYIVSRHYKVHDEKQEAKPGDFVEFSECRPLSRDKRWRLLKVLKSAV